MIVKLYLQRGPIWDKTKNLQEIERFENKHREMGRHERGRGVLSIEKFVETECVSKRWHCSCTFNNA